MADQSDLAAVVARVRAENTKVLGKLSKRIFGHTEPLSARDLDALLTAAEESAKLREAAVNREREFYSRCVELERERDEAREQRDELERTLTNVQHKVAAYHVECERLRAALDSMADERDLLAQDLAQLRAQREGGA